MGAPTRARYLRRKNAATTAGMAVLIGVLASVLGGLSVGGFYTTGTWTNPPTIIQELVKGPVSSPASTLPGSAPLRWLWPP
ncbi:hypothetical protein GU243_24160 (plasmid) [Pseudarthrobacter psychrotolerans]|uniref:Uncharacterized protein n=1 Tax=Pseudarthrobacter psychrotolerans TaxID=2697569 RepID=A0A6P1NU94_9MICC|nr:hypothetical protein [Pseudarthrobacter psychrotolerans]QHK22653.1 hypothetical protein GU243_24160 [Pseudarthrobacter psychrotolerans]